ncbi:MAG: hypothetical protein WC629_00960 [Candidatus Paceibacterota bacterium]|jgi:hypothetical protein
MNNKGSLIIEIMVSSAICGATLLSLSLLVFQSQSILASETLRFQALKIADSMLASSTDISTSSVEGIFYVNTVIDSIDNFTKKITTNVSYPYLKRVLSVSLSTFVTDISESQGQSSCRPVQDIELWKNPIIHSFDLGSEGKKLQPTDIDVVGHYAYIASNTASSSDADFIVLDISDVANPVILSYLNTGPGLLSLHVAGNYAYVGNSSVNSQLQIIDVSDRAHPYIVSSYKLPGDYNDATTVGNVVFYKAGKIYLGTQKSVVSELHVIDVSSPTSPHELSSYEIGSAINDIFAFKDRVYVATPDNEELKIFSFISNNLSRVSSYDASGSGNGKRLSLFLDNLYLGRTVGKDELYSLDASSTPLSTIFHSPIDASIQGLIAYGKLLFILSSKQSSGFMVYGVSSTSLLGNPLNFDCDKSIFAVVYQNSSLVSFVTYSEPV